MLYLAAWIDVLAETAQFRPRPFQQSAAVDHAEPARQVAEQQILGHREFGRQMQLLVDDGDSRRKRRARPGKALRFAAEADDSSLRPLDAGEDLQQRRLAGTVLAHEPVNFTTAHLERGAVERDDARETHADLLHLQEGNRRRNRPRCIGVPRENQGNPSWVLTWCQLSRVMSVPSVSTRGGGSRPVLIQL